MNWRSCLMAGALVLAACASPTDLPKGEPHADGVVMSVSAASVHIKAADENCGIVFRIDDETRILARQPDGAITRAALADVTVGRRAQGWASGPIAESCPAQAGAEVVLVE